VNAWRRPVVYSTPAVAYGLSDLWVQGERLRWSGSRSACSRCRSPVAPAPTIPVFNEYEGGYRLDADGNLIMWMGGACRGWYTQDEYRADLTGHENADIYPLCTVHD
jgi:hypothetical protein